MLPVSLLFQWHTYLIVLFIGLKSTQSQTLTLEELKRNGPRVLVNRLNKDLIDKLRRATVGGGEKIMVKSTKAGISTESGMEEANPSDNWRERALEDKEIKEAGVKDEIKQGKSYFKITDKMQLPALRMLSIRGVTSMLSFEVPTYVPINSKLQHPLPPGKPRAFELLKIGLFKFPPPRAKMVFKCPTLSSDLSVKSAPPKEQSSSAPVVTI